MKYRPIEDRKQIVHKSIILIMRMLHSSLTANNQQPLSGLNYGTNYRKMMIKL